MHDLSQIAPALEIKHREEVLDSCQTAPVVPCQHEVQKSPKVHLIGIALGPLSLVGGHMLFIHPVQEDGRKGSHSVPVPTANPLCIS